MTSQLLRQAAFFSLSLCAGLVCFDVPARPSPQTSQTAPKPDLKRALKAVDRGEQFEKAGNIDEALIAYDEATRYAPQNLAVVARGAVLRSKVIRGYVENAERLAVSGKISQAIEQLRAAMRIDPSNTVVAERLAEMRSMRDDEPTVRAPAPIPGVPVLKPRAGKFNINLRGDSKTAYEQLGDIFGIKAAFDPDLTTRPVRLRLDDVDFETAASLLATETGTFWRPLDPTLMFVTADTPEKRKEYGLEAEQTFPLPEAVASEDMTALLRVLREITGSTRIQLDTSNRSITMRDTPEKLALAGEIIRQVDRARGEIMLEMEILEVDKNTAQQLGITPPSSAQAFLITPNDVSALAKSADLSNALTIVGQIFNAQGFSSVPPFTVVGGGLSTFLLTLPNGVAANFSSALNLVQSGTQVMLRAQDGKPATFFVGDRFPVTLAQLSGSFGTGTGLGTGVTGIPTSATFPQTTFNVGNNPVALASADFNGDGLPDLAVANQNDHTISILLNQDNGNFIPQAKSPIVLGKNEIGPAAIATGIFRNGVLNPVTGTTQIHDLVIANSASNTVTVLLGNGDGTFTEAAGSPFPVGNDPTSVVLADFNGDGNLDFAVANRGDNSISVFKGDGNGGFTQFPASPFLLTNNGSIAEKGPIAMIQANFRNSTLANNTNAATNAPEADLAIVNQATNNVTILLPTGDGHGNVLFTEAPNSPIAVGQSPVALASADLNADGIPDLAVVNQGDNTVSILLASSNADGTFTAALPPLNTGATPSGITIADFTGANVPDLVVTNQGAGTVGIYLGLGLGTFSPRIEIQAPSGPTAIINAILTNSSLPDVALTAIGTTPNQGVVSIIQDSSTFASGSTPTQLPYPGSEYVDLGVKVKATPTLHPNHEVTLQLEFDITALAGTNVNSIPVISNHKLQQTVRVKENETSLIGGLLDQEETRAIAGLPGLANLPGVGYAFGSKNNTSKDSEFLILITPRRLRDPVRHARSIFVGGKGSVSEGTTSDSPPADQQ